MTERAFRKRLWFFLALIIGVVVGGITSQMFHLDAIISLLIGWDAAALVLSTLILVNLTGHSSASTAKIATRDDMGKQTTDFIAIAACIVSIGAVIVALALGGKDMMYIGVSLLTLILSWIVLHSIHIMKYAVMYYGGTKGGIEFNNRDGSDPTFTDFAYLSFSIGVAYQISDNTFTEQSFRVAAMWHSILSFLFSTIIVAAMINFLAGLR